MTCYEEQGLFSRDPGDEGEVPAHLHEEHSIKTGSAPAVSSRPYQHSHFEKLWLKDKLDDLLLQGIIRPYTGPWVSPLVLMEMLGASGVDASRLCTDFRKLNAITELNRLHEPMIIEVLQGLAGHSSYS